MRITQIRTHDINAVLTAALPHLAEESLKKLRKILKLVFEGPLEERAVVEPLVRDLMESVCVLKVPLVVDLGFGPSWAEAK